MGETVEGRHERGQRTERQTPETKEGTIPGTGEETEGPQRPTGKLETPTQRRERGGERQTPCSQGGKWDTEVPGDLIRQEDGGWRYVSLETGGPTILVCRAKEEAPGTGDLQH